MATSESFLSKMDFWICIKNNDKYMFEERFKHEWMNDIKESMLLLSRWTVNFETSQQESR